MPPQRPIREVPNRQVLDSADQFRNGWLHLIGQPPGSGVILPALHCACIAIELYLKSLFATEVEVPDEFGLGSYYIYATSPAQHHHLTRLFKLIPADFQASIEKVARQRPRLSRYQKFTDALDEIEGLFLSSRYSFEATADISKVTIDTLRAIVEVVDQGLGAVPPRIEYQEP